MRIAVRAGLNRSNFDRRTYTPFRRFWDGQRAPGRRPKGESGERPGWPSGTPPCGASGRRFFAAAPWTLFPAFTFSQLFGSSPTLPPRMPGGTPNPSAEFTTKIRLKQGNAAVPLEHMEKQTQRPKAYVGQNYAC